MINYTLCRNYYQTDISDQAEVASDPRSTKESVHDIYHTFLTCVANDYPTMNNITLEISQNLLIEGFNLNQRRTTAFVSSEKSTTISPWCHTIVHVSFVRHHLGGTGAPAESRICVVNAASFWALGILFHKSWGCTNSIRAYAIGTLPKRTAIDSCPIMTQLTSHEQIWPL